MAIVTEQNFQDKPYQKQAKKKFACMYHSAVHINNQSHVSKSLKTFGLTSELAVSRITQTSTYKRIGK